MLGECVFLDRRRGPRGVDVHVGLDVGRELPVDGLGDVVVAAVHKVGPDDHFLEINNTLISHLLLLLYFFKKINLREAEHSQPAPLERVVEHVPRVRHHVLPLEDPEPDEPDLGPVQQQPAVGHLLPPADVARVLPQQADLLVGVAWKFSKFEIVLDFF